MALLRNKAALILAALVATAHPSAAHEIKYGTNYDYLSRSDGISLSAGDASAADIAIQTPTPWPWYVNRTTIHLNARQGTTALQRMYTQSPNGSPSAASGTNTGSNQ